MIETKGKLNLLYTGDTFSEFNLPEINQELEVNLSWKQPDDWQVLSFTFEYPELTYHSKLIIDFINGTVNHPDFSIYYADIQNKPGSIQIDIGLSLNNDSEIEHFTLKGLLHH
jgi:hypothetical protein